MTHLRTRNVELAKEAEELRSENQHLHHEIAAATKRNEYLEMRLLVAVGEKNEVQRELDRIVSDLSQRKVQSENARKKKWIFPAALTAVFLASTFAVGTFWSKRN